MIDDVRKLFIAGIKWYQKRISPLMGPQCRYTPTCSQYALQAIKRYGSLRGTLLSTWRILRCNPWSVGGFDPVPELRSRNSNRHSKKPSSFKRKNNNIDQ